MARTANITVDISDLEGQVQDIQRLAVAAYRADLTARLPQRLHELDLVPGACFHEAHGKGFAGGERECVRLARLLTDGAEPPEHPDGV